MRGMSGNESKREMIRILKTESEGIILDATGKKNGRGALYLQIRGMP